jgi:hypothetical protein
MPHRAKNALNILARGGINIHWGQTHVGPTQICIFNLPGIWGPSNWVCAQWSSSGRYVRTAIIFP